MRLAVFLAAVLASAPAWAEKGDREKEIVVGADRLTADDTNRTSTFEGNVVVTQGTMRMTAARVNVKEDKERHKIYVANGSPVTFRQKRDNVDEWVEGFAERAEFDDRNSILKLSGNARVKSNQNELTGDFITYDMDRAVAEVTGAAPGKTGVTGTGRVKVIIVPPKKEAEGKDKEKPKAAAPLELKADPGKG